MEQHFLINGHSIQVTFDEKVVHIANDQELWNLLNEATVKGCEQLVTAIQKEYQSQYGVPLAISDASLCVEIWGHVYFEYFAIIFEKMMQLHLIEKLTNKISSYCETIDSGESSADHNRFFWDMIAPFKNQIAAFLPKEIDTRNFKRDKM